MKKFLSKRITKYGDTACAHAGSNRPLGRHGGGANISRIMHSSLFAVAVGLFSAGASAETCLASVHYKDANNATGHSALAQKPVSSPGECHQFTRQSFNANKAWSDPYEVCTNTKGRKFVQPVTIWALDRYQEGGQLFNRVVGYTVDCRLAGAVPGVPPTNSTGP